MAQSPLHVDLRTAAKGDALQTPAQEASQASSFVNITGLAGVAMDGVVTENVAWGDYDNDGDQDLFFANQGANTLFRNDGGGVFAEVAAATGVNHAGHALGAAWGDFDNDGDLDLYVVNAQGESDAFFRNEGSTNGGLPFVFTEQTVAAGTTLLNSTGGITLLDYNRDSLLDIYLAGQDADILYENLGDFQFEPVSLDVFFTPGREGSGVVASDVDGNGWVDLFSATRSDLTPILLLNNKGVFTEAVSYAGFNHAGISMGVLAFDGDNDLMIDLYVSKEPNGAAQPNRFYHNLGSAIFVDIGPFTQTTDPGGVAVSGCIGDINNDGWMDYFVANRSEIGGTPSALFVSNGDGTFSNSTFLVLGEPTADARGAAFADFDNDGDLDLAVTGGTTGTQLWRNDIQTLGARGNNFLIYELVGSLSNSRGIGARLTVTLGATQIVREVGAGAGRGSMSALPVHIGMGAADVADRVEVIWPNGRKQVLYNQVGGTVRKLKEVVSADLNNDGLVNILDFLIVLMEWGDCTDCFADITGDGIVGIEEFLLVLTEFTTTGSGPNGEEFPTPNGGWTEFIPAADTVQIYVSSSEGDDLNDGLSEATPLQTIGAGKALLRDEFPDWLLLKRGDVFAEGLGRWTLSGRSSAEPMLVTSYGSSNDRPRLMPMDTSGLFTFDQDVANHLAFVGLNWELDTTVPQFPRRNAVTMLHRGVNILFEDCQMRGFSVNMVLQSSGTGLRNIVIRRCQILDAFSPTVSPNISQGLYCNDVHGLLVEECVIDHNGWNGATGAVANIFSHNVYIQVHCSDVTMRRNVVVSASSHGIQLRPGGECTDSLFVRNPIALLMGGGDDPVAGGVGAIATGNVVLEGNDISENAPRGFGIDLKNIADGVISDNIVANKLSTTGGWFAIGKSVSGGPVGVGVTNTIIENNIVNNWRAPIRFNDTCASVLVTNNTVQEPLAPDNRPLISTYTTNSLEVDFSGNTYHSDMPDGQWFQADGDLLSLAEWTVAAEADLVNGPVTYVDPGRSMATYASSLGYASTHEAFMAEIRQQSRLTWRDEWGIDALLTYFRDGFLPLAPPE